MKGALSPAKLWDTPFTKQYKRRVKRDLDRVLESVEDVRLQRLSKEWGSLSDNPDSERFLAAWRRYQLFILWPSSFLQLYHCSRGQTGLWPFCHPHRDRPLRPQPGHIGWKRHGPSRHTHWETTADGRTHNYLRNNWSSFDVGKRIF